MIKSSSRAGAHHENTAIENQDAVCAMEDKTFAVITMADGVSTCREARMGAQISAEAVTELLTRKGMHMLDLEGKTIAEAWLSQARYELHKAAAAMGEEVKHYASTLSSVYLDKINGRLLYLNLGDSLIIGCSPYQYKILAAPSDSSFGCPVTTAEKAVENVTFGVLDTILYEQVIILSDGAWRSILKKGKLDSVAMAMLQRLDYDAFSAYLDQKNISDDYSYIALSVA